MNTTLIHDRTDLKYEDYIECDAEWLVLDRERMTDEFPLVHTELKLVSEHKRARS